MSVLMDRLKVVAEVGLNKILDGAEDIGDLLDLADEKMREQLLSLRRALVDVAQARKLVEMQAIKLKEQIDTRQRQAVQALGQDNEPLAREALRRKQALVEQFQELEPQWIALNTQCDRVLSVYQQRQAEVRGFGTKKEVTKAQLAVAEATITIDEGATGISSSANSAGQVMQRATDKIASVQARAGAIEELTSAGALHDPNSLVDDIALELERGTTSTQVDADLEALKAELSA